MTDAALPPRDLLERQAARLAPMRSRMLRRVGIAHRGPVLDLGAGHGAVTGELARRSRGPVIALDRDVRAVAAIDAPRLAADAGALPFRDRQFELVFAQLVFLWTGAADALLTEVARVLAPGGALVAIEPDYGGAIEHPPDAAAAPLWREALAARGADPLIGRKLVAALRRHGFAVPAELSPQLGTAADDLALLDGLAPADRIAAIRAARARAGTSLVAHVPFVFVDARTPTR